MQTHGIASPRKLFAATTGLAIALTVAPLGALLSQTTQDTTGRGVPSNPSGQGTNPGNVPIARPFPTGRTTPSTTPTTTTPTTTTPTQTAAVADSTLIREARVGNMLEVRLGALAKQRASDPAVKQFGERMVTDHTTSGQEWAALASRMGLSSTPTLDATQQQSVTQLSALSGTEFDRAYVNTMVQDHQQDAATFQSRGPSAKSSDVRNLAANSLTTVQAHLSLAQQLASQLGTGAVATNPATPSPTNPAGVPPARRVPGVVQPGQGSADIRADARYITELSYGHIMEARLAEMSQQRAGDPKVKQFADRMAADFSSWEKRWIELASNNGIAVNPNMGPLHQEKIQRLRKAPKGQFDRVYLDIVTENLGSMLPYLQKEGRAAHAARVRNLVQEEIPMIQQHLAEAQRLDGQSQADAKSGKGKVKGKDKDKDHSLSSSEK